jgi:hypothetical protein
LVTCNPKYVNSFSGDLGRWWLTQCRHSSSGYNSITIWICICLVLDEGNYGNHCYSRLILTTEISRNFECLNLVSSTRDLIQKLRESGWDTLFKNVILFCDYRIPKGVSHLWNEKLQSKEKNKRLHCMSKYMMKFICFIAFWLSCFRYIYVYIWGYM